MVQMVSLFLKWRFTSALHRVPCFQDCLRQHPEVLDDLHKADELEKQSGMALSSAGH